MQQDRQTKPDTQYRETDRQHRHPRQTIQRDCLPSTYTARHARHQCGQDSRTDGKMVGGRNDGRTEGRSNGRGGRDGSTDGKTERHMQKE